MLFLQDILGMYAGELGMSTEKSIRFLGHTNVLSLKVAVPPIIWGKAAGHPLVDANHLTEKNGMNEEDRTRLLVTEVFRRL